MARFFILGVFLLAACGSGSDPRPNSAAGAQSGASMVSLLNNARAANGQGPLVEDARLSLAARNHAQSMVDHTYFSHQGIDGSSFVSRSRDAGYMCSAAENIASGQRSEARVVSGWMDSPGHRRNILLSDARDFGIGRVGTMWVLVLGRGC